MMLGGPEAVVAELVHQPGYVARGPEYLAQALVRITAIVRRRAVECDLPDIEGVKAFDHVVTKPLSSSAGSPRRPRPAGRARPDVRRRVSWLSAYSRRSLPQSARHSGAARCGPRHPRSARSAR